MSRRVGPHTVLLGSILTACPTTYAFRAFEPNCTTPPDIVNYVAEPAVRGTMTIVWQCVLIVLLCTWSIQHLHVPDRREMLARRNRPGRRRRRRFDDFFAECAWNYTKAKAMLITLIAPECVLGKALTEFLSARESHDQMKMESWTNMHAFFANMRGFVLVFDTTAVPTSLIPGKATAEGRRVHKPIPGGLPTPYYKQDEEDARLAELKQCYLTCGPYCPHRRSKLHLDDGDIVDAQFKAQNEGAVPVELDPTQKHGKETGGEVMNHVGEMDFANRNGHPSPEKTLGKMSDLPPVKTRFGSRRSTFQSPDLATATTLVETPQLPPRRMTLRGISAIFASTPAKNATSASTSAATTTNTSVSGPSVRPDSLDLKKSGEDVLPHHIWQGEWALSALQLEYAYSEGLVGPPPYIPEEDLHDQSKGDALVKGLAICQLTWLMIQVFARAAEDLPITLLEITALAYAVLALVIYALLWPKPQDIKVPHMIRAVRPITRQDVIELAARAPVSTLMVSEFWLHGVAVRAMANTIFPVTRGLHFVYPSSLSFRRFSQYFLPNFRYSTSYLNPVFVGIGLGGLLFGSVHFAAWNFHFPTPVERLLWRISCSMITGLPVFMTFLYVSVSHRSRIIGTDDGLVNSILRRLGHVCVPLYLLARVYLFVEIFRQLAYCLPETFQEISWPSAIPHYA